MKEYQKVLERARQMAENHRLEAEVLEQNILFIETVLAAMEDLNERVAALEKESPYNEPKQ